MQTMSAARTNTEWIVQFEADLTRRFHDRSTAKHYVSDLRLFVRQHPAPLTAVTPRVVDAFVDAQHSQGLAPATVKRRVAALRTFFAFLAETVGEPDRPNPVCMRRHAGRQPRLLPRDLSDAEVQRLLAVVTEPRDQALFNLMLYAGLRAGEVASLRREALCVPDDAATPIRLRVLGKGRKERIVYLTRDAYAPLATYLAQHPATDPTGPLLQTRRGTALTVAGIEERVGHYGQLSGVAVTPHRLRHTYGRWMAESEMPVLTLARLLGHRSIQTTQRYMDGADPQVRRSYEAAMTRRDAQTPAPPAPSAPRPETPADGGATVIRPAGSLCDGADWLPDAPRWLREGCLTWVQQQWGRWKPSQRVHHARTRLRELRVFWRWQLEQREMTGFADLTRADIAGFMTAQLARGLTAKTVKTYVDRIYELLRALQVRGHLERLPERPPLVLPDPLPRYLEPPEVLAVEEQVAQREQVGDAAAWLDVALYYLLGHAGLRISEALDLQVRDLDLPGRRVRIRDGKGRRDRVVYLSERAQGVLRRYGETVPHQAGDLVLSWQGKPLSYEQAWSRIRRLGQDAGIAGLSPHRLRHTYATVLLNNGMGLDALRCLMGHADLKTTLIYARLADTTVEQQYRVAIKNATTAQRHSIIPIDNSV